MKAGRGGRYRNESVHITVLYMVERSSQSLSTYISSGEGGRGRAANVLPLPADLLAGAADWPAEELDDGPGLALGGFRAAERVCPAPVNKGGYGNNFHLDASPRTTACL